MIDYLLQIWFTATWQALVLGLVVFIVTHLLRERLQPRWRYLLWCVVLARLALPILPETPWGIWSEKQNPVASQPVVETQPLILKDVTPIEPKPVSTVTPVVTSTIPATEIVELPQKVEDTIPIPVETVIPIENVATTQSLDFGRCAKIGFLTLWFCGMVFLFAKCFWNEYRFRRQSRFWSDAEDPILLALFESCRKKTGLGRSVRLKTTSNQLGAGCYGIFRPVIVLSDAAIKMNAPDLQMILIHELLHLKRFDPLVLRLSTILSLIHWPNPLVWFVLSRLQRERELACDAAVLHILGQKKQKDYGLAILTFAELFPCREPLPGLVGIFEKNGTERRIDMIIKYKRSKWPQTLLGMVLILLVAAIGLTKAQSDKVVAPNSSETSVTSDNPDTETKPEKSEKTDNVPAEKPDVKKKPFTVTVLNPERKPLPNFAVEFSAPFDKDKDILKGTWKQADKDANSPFGKMITDSSGQFAVNIPDTRDSRQVLVSVTEPGYAPYYALWWSLDRVPSELTVELDAGISVGGIVVDEKGNPIEGVEVSPSINLKTPPDNISNTGIFMGETYKTDAKGKWRVDWVPASLESLGTSFEHPDYASKVESLPIAKIRLEKDEQPSAKTTLLPGLTASGKIVDTQGKPVAGALIRAICFGRNDPRRTRSDEQGNFRFVIDKDSKLIVTAEGFQPTVVKLDDSQLPEIKVGDISLQSGIPVTIRVVDKDGKPCVNAGISLDEWEGEYVREMKDYGLERHQERTDGNGVWHWNSAPKGMVRYSFWATGMDPTYISLPSREEEHLVTLSPEISVSGKVTDAKTGKPITDFKIVPGTDYDVQGQYFRQADAKQFHQGEFIYSFNSFSSGITGRAIRVEADGYRIKTSRKIGLDEGAVSMDFALEPARNISGTVFASTDKSGQRKPIADALVMLSTKGTMPYYRDNVGLLLGSHSMQVYTDPQGNFSFPNPGEPFALVAYHDGGFATDWRKDFDSETPCDLEPVSSRLEGTLFVDFAPAEDVTVFYTSDDNYGFSDREIDDNFTFRFEGKSVATHAGGRFVFEALPSQKGYLGHVASNVRLTDAPIELQPNQTAVVRFGLDKLEMPASFRFPTKTEPRPGVTLVIEGK